MNDKVVEAIEIQNFEEATIEDAKKVMQNMFDDITPKEFEEIKKQAIENVKSKENKDIIFINGKPIIINFNDDKPIIDADHTLLKMNDNWYVVDKVFYDYVDKYQQAIYKIKEYIKEYKNCVPKHISDYILELLEEIE